MNPYTSGKMDLSYEADFTDHGCIDILEKMEMSKKGTFHLEYENVNYRII